jgi:hypothetical protein
VPPLFGDTNLSGKNSGVILKYATQIQVKELAVPHLVSDTKSSNKN